MKNLTNKQLSIVVDIIYKKTVEAINKKFNEEKVKKQAREYIMKNKNILKYTNLFNINKDLYEYVTIHRMKLFNLFPECFPKYGYNNNRSDKYDTLQELIGELVKFYVQTKRPKLPEKSEIESSIIMSFIEAKDLEELITKVSKEFIK